MEPATATDKRKKILTLSLILLATAGIAAVLIATLWQSEDATPEPYIKMASPVQAVASTSGNELLITSSGILSGRLSALQQLDQQFATLVNGAGNKNQSDSLSQLISMQEEIFRGTTDSLALNESSMPDNGMDKVFKNMVSSYKSILESRRYMGSLRNALAMNKKNLAPDEMAMLKIQNELQEKNSQVASLERALKAAVAKKEIALPQLAAVSTDNTAELKENIKAQENKIATLNAAYFSLKQDNEKLVKQQNDASKNPATGELFLKNKMASLQQRVDELNAELRLAQVDCNITRVDAGQIISNSKQRKQLLSEASGILTSLSNSDDAGIKKKVQDKIARLNQVAANSRD